MAEMSETKTTLIACPNPRCKGSVSTADVICSACNHGLGICPQCARLMDKSIGLCGMCGYRLVEPRAAPAAVSEVPGSVMEEAQSVAAAPPVIVRFKPERWLITEVMAEAYCQTARIEADMVSAARTLERVRACFLNEKDALKIWKLLEEEIGTADARLLRPSLISLRAWFKQQLLSQQQERLHDLFQRDPSLGWREWLRTFAEGLARWRLLLCQELVDAPEPFPEQFYKPHDFKRMTRLILHQRWTEVHSFLMFVAHQEFLHPDIQARLLVTAGQIYLYYFWFLDQGLTLFEQAKKLAPNQGYVLSAFGSYYQQKNDLSTARAYFEQAIQAAPDGVDGYIGMGDLAEKQGKLEDARGWYQEAINKSSDDSLGYTRLLRLYGRPEYIETYEPYIVPLAERAIAVDETGEYAIYLDVGNAYAASNRYDDTQRWYQKAIELDRSRLGGYIAKGSAYLKESGGKYDAAREAFRNAIEVAPEAYDGYWGLGQVCERQERWAEASEQYTQAAQRQPEFQSILLSKIGEMQWKMKQYEEAEASLFEALRLEPNNNAVTLHDLAYDYYKVQGRSADSLRIYEQIRKIKGEAYEASYQNRLGNVRFHEGKYEVAARHYSKAINADDKMAVYYSNLAQALQELRDWERARELWNRAPAEVQGDKSFRRWMSLIRNDEANQHYNSSDHAGAIELYEQAIALDPDDAVLHANLAGAWERNGKAGFARFDRAIVAMQEASRLNPKEKNYPIRLARLETLKRLLPAYGEVAAERFPLVTPIALEVAADMIPLVEGEGGGLSAELIKLVEAMRSGIRECYGVHIPGIRFRGNETDLPDGTYIIMLMEIPLASGNVSQPKRFSPVSVEKLRAVGVKGESAPSHVGGPEGTWVDESDWAKVGAAGHELWSMIEYPLRHLQAVLEKNLAELTGNQETHILIQKGCPDLSEAIKQAAGGVPALTRVLRALLEEKVPIVAFRTICGRYLELSNGGTDAVEIVESLRSLPDIVAVLPGNRPETLKLSVGPMFETMIETGIRNDGRIPVLALEPERCQEALTEVRNLIAGHPNSALVVENPRVRAFVRKLVELEFPELPVLSRSEISSELAPPTNPVEIEP